MSQYTDIRTIAFSDEQSMLLETATSFCRDKSPIEKVRTLLDTELGFDEKLWQEVVQLGWTGIAIPAAYGGSELGLGAVATILEPMGRHLMSSPFFATTLAAQLLLHGGRKDQCSEYLPRICEGAAASIALVENSGDWNLLNISAAAVRNGDELMLCGHKTFVLDADVAEFILVSLRVDDEPALVLLNRDDLVKGALCREVVQDETRRSYHLNLEGISVDASALLDAARVDVALEHLNRVAALLYAAEMAGGIAGVLAVVVDYLNTRKQFDRLIGSYQALKHPTVDMLMGLEAARSHVYHAATVMDDSATTDVQREVAVHMAKAVASDAFAYAGDRAIQFHGGFGFTYECDAQLYLRRALFDQYQFGDAAHHRSQLAGLLL